MDRDAFLNDLDAKLREANAQQEQKRVRALARVERMKEAEAIIKPYDEWFKSHGVRTSLGITGQPPKLLTWRLPFTDGTSTILSIRDDDAKEALELDLSLDKAGKPAVYVPLPFAGPGGAGRHIEARAASMRLDERWSAETFESFVQDLITAFLDDAVHHGGTAVLRTDGG